MSDNPDLDLPGMGEAAVAPGHAVAALALNFALKWFDMTLVKDGVMYQQKKMEGVNFNTIDLPDVFEVAKQFEAHILNAPNRLSEQMWGVVVDVIAEGDPDDPDSDIAQGDPA